MNQIFGQIYAPAYDVLYRDKDYDGEIELLRRVFLRYATQPVRKVLDLGCGTGSHAIRLAASGYQIVGVDRSSDMLAVADHKSHEQAVSLRFHQADIRDVDLGDTFDAVIMMFAVLSYQQEDAHVRSVLRIARHHLRPNGLLLFDVWYGPAVAAQGPQQRVRTIEQDGNTWVRTSSGRLDNQLNLCHVDFYLRRMSGDRILDEVKETHTVRYFFPDEIEQFLNDSGFRLLRLGAFPAFDREPDHTTWNVMAVAVAA
jgi:SAM-dependent methyltransferase